MRQNKKFKEPVVYCLIIVQFHSQKYIPGVPTVVQWDGCCLGTTGHSFDPQPSIVLGIQYCCSCSLGHNCSLDLILDPRTPYTKGRPKKKKKKSLIHQHFVFTIVNSCISIGTTFGKHRTMYVVTFYKSPCGILLC